MVCAPTLSSQHTELNSLTRISPALVATLWDVTDKDIDRFSQSVFRSWGLLNPPPPISSSSSKQSDAHGGGKKGGNRAATTTTATAGGRRTPSPIMGNASPVSLTKAVAQARDACVLKYLNGAATVVYGIPVYLS